MAALICLEVRSGLGLSDCVNLLMTLVPKPHASRSMRSRHTLPSALRRDGRRPILDKNKENGGTSCRDSSPRSSPSFRSRCARARRPRTTLPVPSGSPFRSAPGGGGDVSTRALADELSKALRQPVVENRPGGALNTGTRACAESAPDGYTICVLSSKPMVYNRFAFKSLPFDPEKDFE